MPKGVYMEKPGMKAAKEISKLLKSISLTEDELIEFIRKGLMERIWACPGQNVGVLLHPDEAMMLIKVLGKYQKMKKGDDNE